MARVSSGIERAATDTLSAAELISSRAINRFKYWTVTLGSPQVTEAPKPSKLTALTARTFRPSEGAFKICQSPGHFITTRVRSLTINH